MFVGLIMRNYFSQVRHCRKTHTYKYIFCLVTSIKKVNLKGKNKRFPPYSLYDIV